MGLQLRRGTNAERLQITPLAGELLYTTDTKVVYVGDGATIGGLPVTAFTAEEAQDTVAPMFVNGSHTGIAFSYNDAAGTINAVVSNTATEEIVAPMFVNGSHVGITFTYNQTNGTIDAVVASTPTEVINDPMPQLGGDLNLNTFDITGAGNINIVGDLRTQGIDITGSVLQSLDINSALYIGSRTDFHRVTFNSNSTLPSVERLGLTTGVASFGEKVLTARTSIADGSQEAIVAGDRLYSIDFRGWSGESWTSAAGIQVFADPNAAITTSSVPGFVIIGTTKDGGLTGNGISVNSSGQVGINKLPTDMFGADLDINGVLKLEPLAAEPANPTNGMIAVANGVEWDPLTNGKQSLVVRLGGAWVSLASAA